MSFVKKMQLLIAAVFVIILATTNFVATYVSEKNRAEIKKYFLDQYYSQFSIENQLKNFEERLTAILHDWAEWDESYNFIKTKSKKYLQSNFGNDDTLYDLGIEGFLFYDKNKKFVYGRIVQNGKEYVLSSTPGFLKEIVKKMPQKIYIFKNGKIYLVETLPITDTKVTKSNGYLLAYKIITPKEIKGFDKVFFNLADAEKFSVKLKNSQIIITYVLEKNVIRPVKITLMQDISAFIDTVKKNKIYFNITLTVIIVLIFTFLYLFLQPVLKKLGALSNEITKIPTKDNITFPEFKESEFKRIVDTLKDVNSRVYELLYFEQMCKFKNRNALFEDIKKHNNISLAVINIKKFSSINAIFGYESGNEILCKIGEFINGYFENFYHVGEDRFAVFDSVPKNEMLKKLMKLKENINKNFYYQDKFISVDINAGISSMPEDTQSHIKLFEYASIALSLDKDINLFNKVILERTKYYMELEQVLKEIIAKKNIQMHYQPIVDIHSNRVVSAEALMRITDKRINIEDFFFVATQVGNINEITKIVLDKTLKDISKMKKLLNVKISVNLSAKDIENFDLFGYLNDLINRYRVNYTDLALEITERDAVEREELIGKFIKKAKEMNVIIEIDDFGVANSSLNQLSKIHFDIVKIDKIFTDLILTDQKVAKITKFIIELTHSLNGKVIAEGVESAEQFEWLKKNGCDYIQGYYFSKPLPLDVFIEYVKKFNAI